MDPIKQNDELNPNAPPPIDAPAAPAENTVATPNTAPAQDIVPQPAQNTVDAPAAPSSEPVMATQPQPISTAPGQVPVATSSGIPAVIPPAPVDSQPAKPSRKKWLKIAIVAVVALAIVGGSSAAAYFGYVVPNKPETILAEAVKNTLQQKQMHTEGTMAVDDKEVSMKMTFKGQNDLAAKVASGEGTLTMSGVDVSMEFRFVEDNVYFRFSDLATAKSLVSAYAAMMADDAGKVNSFIDAVVAAVDGQWIAVDSTLLKQAKVDCMISSDAFITNDDIKLLEDQYMKNPFVTIEQTSSEDINGTAAQKFELKLDNSKSSQYVGKLKDLSYLKKLRECTGEELDTSTPIGSGSTNVTVWVDKENKRIVKIGATATVTESGQSVKTDIAANIAYDPVSVLKPEGSKPLLQVIGDLVGQIQRDFPEFYELLNGGGSSVGDIEPSVLND